MHILHQGPTTSALEDATSVSPGAVMQKTEPEGRLALFMHGTGAGTPLAVAVHALRGRDWLAEDAIADVAR